jgi:HAD superfamily hydrolase (TIGR01509 family)
MLQLPSPQAVIFDVDDTLLNNYPDGSKVNIHEQSRLMAAHQVGKRHAIPGLQVFTIEQCLEAFLNAKTHTLEGAAWEMLRMAGVVKSEEIDRSHPLLLEIIELKDQLHEAVLRKEGREVPGATRFVEGLAAKGLQGKMGIASTAYRRDVDIFLEMTQLHRFFPEPVIITRERFTNAKPHPDAFNTAFAALELPENSRKDVVAFEDDPRGIASAKAAGLYTCAITTRYDKYKLGALETPPDLVADSFAEFEAIFGLR